MTLATFEIAEVEELEQPTTAEIEAGKQKLIASTAATKKVECAGYGGRPWPADYPIQKNVQASFGGDVQGVHRNYIEYLEGCWAGHMPAVMSPDIMWFTILSELAAHIVKNADHYRPIFTTAEEGKTEIVVQTDSPTMLPVDKVIGELHRLCPTDVDKYIPEFSTSTKLSTLAVQATFLEAVSPYYDYMMMLCGIPKVRLDGTEEDWQRIEQSIAAIATTANPLPEANDYLVKVASKVMQIMGSLRFSNSEFWGDMFRIGHCGSGHQAVVEGWIGDLFLAPPKLAYPHNFPTHISKVAYKELVTGNTFTLHAGLLSSAVDSDGFLVPQFGFMVNQDMTDAEAAASAAAVKEEKEKPPEPPKEQPVIWMPE
jgi:hypothetical protein